LAAKKLGGWGVDSLENSSKIKTVLESVEVGSWRDCYVNPADRGRPWNCAAPWAAWLDRTCCLVLCGILFSVSRNEVQGCEEER